jgi:hypothetical protein
MDRRLDGTPENHCQGRENIPESHQPDFDALSILRSTKADKIASSTDVSEIASSDYLLEVLKLLENNSNALVRGFGDPMQVCEDGASDALFTRLSLLQSILESKGSEDVVSSLCIRSETARCVRGDETLDAVVSAMLASRCEVVGVVDQGTVTGIITCAALISHLRQHLAPSLSADGAKTARSNIADSEEDDDDDDAADGLLAGLKGDGAAAAAAAARPCSEHRMVAQRFVDSWCCELLIAM